MNYLWGDVVPREGGRPVNLQGGGASFENIHEVVTTFQI